MILFLGILLFIVDIEIYFSTLCHYVEQQPISINVGQIHFGNKTVWLRKVLLVLFLRNKQIKAYIFGDV